jgi:peptide/nickel transport system ATP-binding protein
VPELRPGWLEEAGEVRAPEARPGSVQPACPFFPRCPVRIEGVCDRTPPPARELAKGARILCHRTEDELRRMLPERPHRAAALAGAA